MRYSSAQYELESDSKALSSSYSSTRQSNVIKRLFLLSMMLICLVFAGVQSTPAAAASQGCELVCGDPFIDPNTGQCSVMCCPADVECKGACELRPCQ
jgi:hypothetical protein